MYDYISENLQKLSDGSLKIDDFTKQISNKMQKEYGVIITDEWLDFANGYYQNHEVLESYGLPAEVAKHWSFNANQFNTSK